MYRWMYASLVPERLDRFYSCSVFKSLFLVDQCLLDLKVLGPPKKGVLQIGPRNKTEIFGNTALAILIKFQ